MIKRIGFALFLLGIINFIAFGALSFKLGGTAHAGKLEDGRFYLGNHGKYSEASEGVYNYSLWHGRSIMVTHPLAIVGAIILIGCGKRSRKSAPSSRL